MQRPQESATHHPGPVALSAERGAPLQLRPDPPHREPAAVQARQPSMLAGAIEDDEKGPSVKADLRLYGVVLPDPFDLPVKRCY